MSLCTPTSAEDERMLSPLPGLAWRLADEGGTGQQVSAHQLALQASKVVSLARMQRERACMESTHAERARVHRKHACVESTRRKACLCLHDSVSCHRALAHPCVSAFACIQYCTPRGLRLLPSALHCAACCVLHACQQMDVGLAHEVHT